MCVKFGTDLRRPHTLTKTIEKYPRGTVDRWGKKISMAWTLLKLSNKY